MQLKTDIKDELSNHADRPFRSDYDKGSRFCKLIEQILRLTPSIGHLRWLMNMYTILYILWIVMFAFAFCAQNLGCKRF